METRTATPLALAAATLHQSAKKGSFIMFCNSCNNGWLWIIIILILLFAAGGNGLGCGCNCENNNGCGCGCN
jgi:hypothetical protein